MGFIVALTLVVGTTLGGFSAIQAQQAISGKRETPPLTDHEFERLYDRMTGIWARRPDKSTYTGSVPPDRLYVIYEADG